MVDQVARRAESINQDLGKRLGGELAMRGEYWRTALIESAEGDDELLLRLIADHLLRVEEHAALVRELRDQAARRLREEGVPMTRVAALARVSDSYLSRRLFDKGAKRKVVRGRREITALSAAMIACALGAEGLLMRMANIADHYVASGGLLT